MSAGAFVLSEESRHSFWRTLLTFSVTRVVIALLLFVYLGFNVKKDTWDGHDLIYMQVGIAYLALAMVFAFLAAYHRRRFFLQLMAQVAFDILAISAIYVTSGGGRAGLAILFLFPLAGTAILAPLLPALAAVSVVTIFLLGESLYQSLATQRESFLSQAGLYCAAFFAAAIVINRLAARLIKQEILAEKRGHDLQMQQAVNRLVIADTADGILVVGPDGDILTANPAAEQMLGLSFPYGAVQERLKEIPSLLPIAEIFFAWQARGADALPLKAEASAFVVIKRGDMGGVVETGGRREAAIHLKLRFARVEVGGRATDRTVIFMQDVTEIENRAQQLKLASMGRLTASIAHEVRNPLSAISYAASLLMEDLPDPAQKRLLNIIADNVARMNRMIEDILKLSRKAHQQGEATPVGPVVAEVLGEFELAHGLKPGTVRADPLEGYRIRFDALHLREVLANLLSNAARYASGRAGSIRIRALAEGEALRELHVQDDGPPISPEVRAHLFEPFYTTSSKGTGLGLYLARELCLNNGAKLDYENRVDDAQGAGQPSGRFVIAFALSDQP